MTETAGINSESLPKGRNIPTTEITGLQYLRGISAIAVVIDHASGMANLPKYFGIEILDGFLKSGARGVDVFFVISGFIIVVSSLRGGLQPKLSIKKFLLKRAQRILPLMWIAVLSYALLRVFARGGWDISEMLTALTLFPAGAVAPTVIWTLRLELIFYLIFALTILRSRKTIVFFVFWAISPIFIALFQYANAFMRIDLTAIPPFIGEMVNNFGNSANIEFSAGVLLGVYYLQKGRQNFPAWSIDPAWILTISVFGFMVISYNQNLKFDDVRSAFISAIAAGSIVTVAAYVRPSPGFWDFLFALFGNASYAIYLFHSHIISAMLGILARFLPGMPIELVIAVCTSASIVGGIIVHKVVEVPTVRWAKSFSVRAAHN